MTNTILAVSGIYAIKNITNGKKYIGSAVNLKTRLKQHKSDLNVKKHCNVILQSAWNKYGAHNFVFEVFEVVPNKFNLVAREQYWIDYFQSAKQGFGYNICKVAGSTLGIKQTRDSVERGHAKLRGVKRDPEICRKISEAKMGFKFTEEQKLRMSIAGKNRKPATDEARRNMSIAQTLRNQRNKEINLSKSIALEL